ncbi:MAG: divergent PAP2 family protein [Lachnospiraceae bacterium]|nr:divergent PAP2 family protein [Lachnospiraceae bacterium]
MNYLTDLLHNRMLITAFLGWGVAQIVKTIIDCLMNKRVNLERLVGSGGMPSCHSSTVCALCVAAGAEYGLGSPVFALATVLAIIVMYDARGVRRETGNQAEVLNQIMEFFRLPENGEFKLEFNQEQLKVLIGHTPLQVICGAILGIIVGVISLNVLPV